jgi:hypothetical protein
VCLDVLPHRVRGAAGVTRLDAHEHLLVTVSAWRTCLTPRYWQPGRMARYEYRVLQLRESLIGGKLSGDKLERILNDEAAKGWQLRAITSTEVKGRIGPGGVEGLLVTFERPVG